MAGWRFRRPMRLLPGVRLNLSGRGFGVRLGPRGAGVSVGPSGTRMSASLPGTGLYYTQKLASGEPASTARTSRGRGGGCLRWGLYGGIGAAALMVCGVLFGSLGTDAPDPAVPLAVPVATFTSTTLPPTATPTPAATSTPMPEATIPPTATPAPVATDAPAPMAVPAVAVTERSMIATTQANLRASPGTDGQLVGSLAAGEAVTVVGANASGDWLQLAGGEWVFASLLAEAGLPAAVVPVRAVEPVPVQAGPVCECDRDAYKCDDFPALGIGAQACFDYCRSVGAGDIHRLDQDGDGSVCEN